MRDLRFVFAFASSIAILAYSAEPPVASIPGAFALVKPIDTASRRHALAARGDGTGRRPSLTARRGHLLRWFSP